MSGTFGALGWDQKQIPCGNDRQEKQGQRQKQVLHFVQDDKLSGAELRVLLLVVGVGVLVDRCGATGLIAEEDATGEVDAGFFDGLGYFVGVAEFGDG